VLEIGCGEGRLTWRYARSTRLTVASTRPRLAARRNGGPACRLAWRAFFARASSLHLPFQKETFDIAVLAWSL